MKKIENILEDLKNYIYDNNEDCLYCSKYKYKDYLLCEDCIKDKELVYDFFTIWIQENIVNRINFSFNYDLEDFIQDLFRFEDYVEKKYQDRKIKSITTKNGGVDITYIDKNSNKTFTVSYNGVPEGFVRDIIENIDSYSYFDIKNKL